MYSIEAIQPAQNIEQNFKPLSQMDVLYRSSVELLIGGLFFGNIMKMCKKCKIEKPIDSFYKNRPSKDGRLNNCKLCFTASSNKYRKNNPKKISKANSRYYAENKDKAVQYQKDNSEHIALVGKKYKKENAERVSIVSREYRQSAQGKAAKLRTQEKYPNAHKSGEYFRNHNKKTYPGSCQSCKIDSKVQAHHCDYDKPMDVIFLCNWCHLAWHKIKTPLNRVSGIFTPNKNHISARG